MTLHNLNLNRNIIKYELVLRNITKADNFHNYLCKENITYFFKLFSCISKVLLIFKKMILII